MSKCDEIINRPLYLQQAINALVNQATPKDNSAPLQPLIEIGHLVVAYKDLIDRALVCYRNELENFKP